MKNFSELIGLRRSHRKFTTEPVDENSIKALLRSALIAPSSKGLHSYEFVVVKDRDNLQALSAPPLTPEELNAIDAALM